MSDYHIYDNHTLYIETGISHRNQIEYVLKIAIEKLNIPCKFKVNLVTNKDGYCGYSYIWISSPQVYNALIGKNFNGLERVEWIDDPKWVLPSKPLNDALEDLMNKKENNLSWSDESERENNIRDMYKCPKIKVELEPLIKISGYEYDNEQMEYLNIRAKESGDIGSIPDMGYFEIAPAYVSELEDNLSNNVLLAQKIPNWITSKILKDIFENYASDPKTLCRRKINGEYINITFPHINIHKNKDKNSAFITFDPSTNDSRFALLMTRKLEIVDRQKKIVLIFNHSFINKQ